MPKKVIVTGGAGFIGSHTVEALLNLESPPRVVAIDNFSTGHPQNVKLFQNNPSFEFVEADICDRQRIEPFFEDADWVIHLAALADIVPSIERPTDYHHSNVDGTLSVLECARNAGVKRFVYSASSSCYGIPDEVPTPETAEIRPQYPYALTKYLGEELVLHWAKIYGLPAVSLRFFNVFGPRSRTSGTYGAVFGVFLAQKLKSLPFTVVGDGNQSRDFTFVTDIVSALLRAAESDASGEIYNVGSGGHYTVNRLVELLGGEHVFIPKRPGEPDVTFAEISKIQRDLGWRPRVSFEEGVKRILENIDYWREAPAWTPEKIGHATEKWFKYLGPQAGGQS